MKKRIYWNTETFVQKLMSIYGDDFDYRLVEYTKLSNKVFIVCKKHGLIYKRAGDLFNGHGCQKCYNERMNSDKRDTFESMVEKVYKIHGDNIIIPRYDYKNDKEKTIAICHIHGEFITTPNRLKNGEGCKLCSYDKLSKKFSDTTDLFKKKFIKKYGDRYDLSKVNLENKDENGKIILICHKKYKNGFEHGEFKITPNNALKGHGCPNCKSSILELELKSILEENNVSYEYHKKFNWLGKQELDFYLPEYNIGVECQGIQHFKPIDQFGGVNSFNYQIKMDNIKLNKCKENGVNLLYYTSSKLKKEYIKNALTSQTFIKKIYEYGKI